MARFEKAGAPTNGVDEVQLLTPGGVIDGGTWTITYAAQATATIAWNANAAAIQAALEALSNVVPGDIVVTGGPISTGVVTLTFGGLLGGTDVGQVTVDVTSLTGAGHALTPSTSVAGVLGSFRGAAPGSEMVDTTGGQAYVNSGTANTPVWIPVTARSAASTRFTPQTKSPPGTYDIIGSMQSPTRLG